MRHVLGMPIADTDKILLAAARQLAAKVSPADAVTLNAPVLETGTLHEKQAAIATIGDLPVPEADKVILAQLDHLAAGQVPPALSLDLIEAASKRNNPEIKKRLQDRETKLAQSKDPQFYEFLKKLEAYQLMFGDGKTVLLLSTHREILDEMFKSPRLDSHAASAPSKGTETASPKPAPKTGGQ